MRALLPAGFRQREERVKVLIPSRMRVGTQWVDIVIHNVSSRGLMGGCDQPPPPGTYVEIRRGTLVIVGRAVWTKGRFFGLRSQDRLSVKALVEEPRLAGRPQRVAQDNSDERRSDNRLQAEARLARQVERSRAFAAAFQYGVAAAVVLTVAGLGASTVYDVLSKPAATIAHSMAQATSGK